MTKILSPKERKAFHDLIRRAVDVQIALWGIIRDIEVFMLQNLEDERRDSYESCLMEEIEMLAAGVDSGEDIGTVSLNEILNDHLELLQGEWKDD